MMYDIFFTLLSNGKTYKVYSRLSEQEVLDIVKFQGISMIGVELNVIVRGAFKSGNSELNGQIGFWDISVSQS